MHIKFRLLLFIVIPLVLLPLVLVHRKNKPLECLYMLIIMASFWFLDILPYGVTSLFPVMFAPLMEISTASIMAQLYSSDSLMLCLGRLIMACAFQKQQVHRRFGLFLLQKFGSHPRWTILACMIPSYILTMFISNTATAPIMLEFAIEILEVFKKIDDGTEISTNFQTTSPEFNYGSNDPILNNHRGQLPDHLSFLKTMGNAPNWENEYPSMVSVVSRPNSTVQAPEKLSKISESIRTDPTVSLKFKNFTKALFLSTGYAASSGAVATIVACGPNLVFYGIAQNTFGVATNLNYGTFIAIGLPMSVVTLFLTWVWVGIFHLGPREFLISRKPTEKEKLLKEKIQEMKEELGPISFAECSCIGLTAFVIVLWITRQFGESGGWGNAFKVKDKSSVTDATPMILVIALFYIWPAQLKFWKSYDEEPVGSERLLSWDFTHKNLPWSIIFLLGAGFAMTQVCNDSGLSSIVGKALTGLKGASYIPIVFLASALSCVSTEFLSSTSALPIYISIFIKLACHMKIHPFLFLFPLTFSASFAFCLPAATTPNIAIFNRGLATTFEMIKTGLLLDIVFIVLVSLFSIALVPPLFIGSELNPIFINCTDTN